MPALAILASLLLMPLMEIAVFILIGGQIGVGYTLALILLTAIIGTFLLRRQGLQTISEIRTASRNGGVPTDALMHGLMILIAGVLLLTPGFVTDSVGFVLFVPAVRLAIISVIKQRLTIVANAPEGPDGRAPVVDLDPENFTAVDPGNSPWIDRPQK